LRGEASRLLAWVAAATIVGAALRWYGAAEQPPLRDEVHMAFTAHGYVAGGQTLPSMPHHPNLRNLLVSWSLRVFGAGGLGLRFWSLLLGTASIPLLGWVVLRLTGRPAAGALAAFLLAADPLHVAFSRQTIQETHVVFLSLLGVALVLRYLDGRDPGPERGHPLLLVLAGAVFGLGLASKLQAAMPLGVCLALVVRRSVRDREAGTAALAVVSFTLVPLTVVALTDAPWFGRGYGLDEWVFMRRAVLDRMSAKYVPLPTETNLDRSAWEWFVRPFAGYASFSVSDASPVVTVGMGNPLVWLLVLPSALVAATTPGLRRQTARLQTLFWVSYLPFLVAGRPIFFLTALAVAPWAFGLVAVALDHLTAASPPRRRALPAYAGAVLAISVLLQPLATGDALRYPHSAALARRFDPHPGAPPPASR
jgi:dolichyl-phosphate-mannose--protein O-mannosyl transferase